MMCFITMKSFTLFQQLLSFVVASIASSVIIEMDVSYAFVQIKIVVVPEVFTSGSTIGDVNNKRNRLFNSYSPYDNDNTNNNIFEIKKKLERIIQDDEKNRLWIEDMLGLPSNNKLIPVDLIGKSYIQTPNTKDDNNKESSMQLCAVLHQMDNMRNNDDTSTLPGLLIPLNDDTQWRLLKYTYEYNYELMKNQKQQKQMISTLTILGWNAVVVNRDDGIFDNLPYTTWTTDPNCMNEDAAQNPINSKYHLGKRRAYQRLLTGKDWGLYNINNRTTTISQIQIQNQQKWSISNNNPKINTNIPISNTIKQSSTTPTSSSNSLLTMRILQLKIKELEMDIAECDYEIAIMRKENDELDEMKLQNEKENLINIMNDTRQQMEQLQQNNMNNNINDNDNNVNNNDDNDYMDINNNNQITEENGNNIISWLLDRISQWSSVPNTSSSDMQDLANRQNTSSSSSSSSSSLDGPYDTIIKIMKEQLNAKVIGAVIENTNLFDDGTIKLGGLIILQRIIPRKNLQLDGETIQISDKDETYGNVVKGGETIIVECYPEEAIGISLACSNNSDDNNNDFGNTKLWIEQDIWNRGSIMVKSNIITEEKKNDDNDASSNNNQLLTKWIPTDNEISMLIEGQSRNISNTERVIPIRISRYTNTLFDQMFDKSLNNKKKSMSVFSTENPITSLLQYDIMSNEDKVRTLLMLNNFNGKLPRPRKLRIEQQMKQSSSSTMPSRNVLDELLLPYIDESVRLQYKIREATNNNDINLVNELNQYKSRRHIAKDNVNKYYQLGMIDEAIMWENEVKVLESLRADITQDETSYSSFLDKDEWYEKQRQKTAKNVNRKMFGNALDGIE